MTCSLARQAPLPGGALLLPFRRRRWAVGLPLCLFCLSAFGLCGVRAASLLSPMAWAAPALEPRPTTGHLPLSSGPFRPEAVRRPAADRGSEAAGRPASGFIPGAYAAPLPWRDGAPCGLPQLDPLHPCSRDQQSGPFQPPDVPAS